MLSPYCQFLKIEEFGLTQDYLSYKSGIWLRFIRDIEQGKLRWQMNKVNHVLWLFGFELVPTKAIREE